MKDFLTGWSLVDFERKSLTLAGSAIYIGAVITLGKLAAKLVGYKKLWQAGSSGFLDICAYLSARIKTDFSWLLSGWKWTFRIPCGLYNWGLIQFIIQSLGIWKLKPFASCSRYSVVQILIQGLVVDNHVWNKCVCERASTGESEWWMWTAKSEYLQVMCSTGAICVVKIMELDWNLLSVGIFSLKFLFQSQNDTYNPGHLTKYTILLPSMYWLHVVCTCTW